MIRCPKCKGLSTIPIVYGKPGPDLLAAADRGLVILAGCVAREESQPSRQCLDCNFSWAGRVDSEQAAEMLDEVKTLVDRNLFAIFTGMASPEVFPDDFQMSSSRNSLDDYLRLKQILNIYQGCESQNVMRLRSFSDENPSLITEIREALEMLVISPRPTDFPYEKTVHRRLFQVCALLLNASPIAHGQWEDHGEVFLENIRLGMIGFE